MHTILKLWRMSISSARETFVGCQWVYTELVSAYARRQILFSILTLLAGTVCLMATPFIMKFVIDTYTASDTAAALQFLLLAAFTGLAATAFGTAHDFYRERAWNKNFLTVHTTLVRKMYGRTLDEIVAEDSEVGAEQIESLKDKVRNILYLFLFESSIVLATILVATSFLFVIDVAAGLWITTLTIFNFIWFFFLNTFLNERMEPIDFAFRKATRRVVEKLNLVASVKAAGVEDKMVREIDAELQKPLQSDFYIWGIWFLRTDSMRRAINAVTPVMLLMYGVYEGAWTPGELAAVSSWAFAISREYGFFGHLMRHLASQVARIKATREALMVTPDFDYDTGIEYERNKDAHSI